MTTYQQHLEQAMAERGPDHPVWKWNDKLTGRHLAGLAGVRAPEILADPVERLDDVTPPTVPAVLKPVHGCSSRGVLALQPTRTPRVYRELLSGTVVTWEQVLEQARADEARHERLRQAGHPDALRGPWILEELLIHDCTLADDWKAFCVGGEPVVIRQCRRTRKSVQVKWYDATWSDVGDIMPVRKWHYTPDLPGPRHPVELLAAFRRVAAHVESPFIRVDLYEDDRGPVFGEITPQPSGGGTRFLPEWDARLGAAWTAAL